MIYYIFNPFIREEEIFDTEQNSNAQELAQAKLQEYQQAYLTQEANRFHFAKVTKTDLGEIWSDGNVVNDSEQGDYHVFNQYTGLYDAFSTLIEVKMDIAAKQQQFLVNCKIDKVLERVQPIAAANQPQTTGTQTA
jgi:hypothetical protein